MLFNNIFNFPAFTIYRCLVSIGLKLTKRRSTRLASLQAMMHLFIKISLLKPSWGFEEAIKKFLHSDRHHKSLLKGKFKTVAINDFKLVYHLWLLPGVQQF